MKHILRAQTTSTLLRCLALALLVGNMFSASPALAQIVCHNNKDERITTMDARDCVAKDDPVRMAADRAKKLSVNFRTPTREYVRIEGQWQIFVESNMAAADPEKTAKATRKLQLALSEILASLPTHSHRMVQGLKFFLMWGEESPLGGLKSGMRAVRDGGHPGLPTFDPAWKNAIIIYSTRNFLGLDKVWTNGALVHEISHSWQLAHWPVDDARFMQPWRAAKSAELYRGVIDYKGNIVLTGYALTNQLEYFAELSTIYFVGGNYHPFDKAGLKKYDPAGYQMVENVWGIQ